MEILVVLVLLCVALASGAVIFFAWTVRQGTFDHTDRLELLPLDEETAAEHPEGKDEN